MEDTENIRFIVCQRIEQVENAMKSLQSVRKTLMHKAYEAKQSILSAYISQRDSMQSEEMNLLVEVDKLLHSKDDVLVTQLSKLSQVLGCLRNCLQSPHPCGECLEKFDDIDMLSADEVSLEFSAANEVLKRSIAYQPRLLQDTMYSSYSPQSTNGADILTKWLLTPSNNHTATPPRQQEFVFTEWLLLDRDSSCTDTGTPDIFVNVKKEATDLWLSSSFTPSMDYSGDTGSAYDSNDWLHKDCCSRQTSVCDDDEMESDVTSSVHSSIVIISGSTSEDGSASTVSDRMWTRDTMPANQSPYKVSEWVATCAAADEGDCGEILAERRMSVGSLRSSLGEPMQASSNEWLPQANEDECGERDSWAQLSQNWLNAPSVDSLCDKFSTSKLDIASASENSGISLHDWHAKDSPTSDVWLSSSVQQAWLSTGGKHALSLEVDDWLTGEEKRDEPKASSRSQSDRDWLLIKNEMSRIVTSDNSEWINSASVTDNRLSTSTR